MTFPLFLLLFHFNFATSRDTWGGGESDGELLAASLPHFSRRRLGAVAGGFVRLGVRRK
jgi:hypothetical protein